MSDEASGQHGWQSPRKRNEALRVTDITMMVRVPGQPAAVRVYTDEEAHKAARYAAESGGSVVPLPLPPPRGYVRGTDGQMLPEHESGTDLRV